MSLVNYFYDHDPFMNFSDFNRLFDDAWNIRFDNRQNERGAQRISDGTGSSALGFTQPRMDLHESKEKGELTATFELPGLTKEDVNIDVHNNRLTVSGRTTFSNDLDQDGYSVRERRYGKFSRTIPLPNGTKPESIKANMDNGVLTVRFPASGPEQEAKRITIS